MPASRAIQLTWALIVSVSGHVGLLLVFDLAGNLWATLGLVAAGFAGLPIAERKLRSMSPVVVGWTILCAGLLMRLLVLPLPPSLSGDVHRYLWDGRVLAAGFDPYTLTPDAPELEPLRDARWQQLDHRDVATVYPPLAQALFLTAASTPKPLLTFKSILLVLDLISCALLLVLARRWRLPPERVVWYAWNPLVTIEIVGMGHVDGFGVTLVLLTTGALVGAPRRLAAAVAAATGAVLAKLVPLLAIPVWARQSGRPRLFGLLVLSLTMLALLPVVLSAAGPPPGLVRYGIDWEFNGPLFEPLWRLFEAIELSSIAAFGLDRLKDLTNWHDFWNLFYPLNYPQLWAKGVLAVGLAAALVWSWRSPDMLTALRRVFGSVIMCSATVYPWYALWVLPWAALSRTSSWLVLSALLFLSYLPQVLDVSLFPWIHGSIWIPFALMAARIR